MAPSNGTSSNGRLPDGELRHDGEPDGEPDDAEPDEAELRHDAEPDDAEPDEGDLPESLEEALLAEAADLPGVTVRTAGALHAFMVGAQVVATLEGRVAEFRLDQAVAAAALRTPGTRRSPTAPDRIAFAPEELDLYALDRAVAWLRSAVRLATR